MEITSKLIYDSIIHGAYEVIKNKEILNKINIFPVQDGDTGSNLASMMRSIIRQAEMKLSVKSTIESIADAALVGARGNSGIIFAQYLTGLGETMDEGAIITVKQYARACCDAVQYAYDAIEEPVEGTIITIMKAWGNALTYESSNGTSISDIFNAAFSKLEIALEKTKDQLVVLKKADVVDSGAKGFACFIEGASYYFKNGNQISVNKLYEESEYFASDLEGISHNCSDGYRYCTECLLEGMNIDKNCIKKTLHDMGSSIVVAGSKKKHRVHIHTNNVVGVFDYLNTIGTIIFQKVDDMYKQEKIVNRRKSNIALVTDSIADIPKSFIDEHQIHIIHLDILFKDMIYMDKLTITPSRLLEASKDDKKLPTSSQPNRKQIEYVFDYLSTYYDDAIILTVSKELSGTYSNILNVANRRNNSNFKAYVINSKQNSGAQGLLVKKCAELIDQDFLVDEIIEKINNQIKRSKILVQVRTIDNMIKSGRLSVRAGKLAKFVGLKPIVTLDNEGKGSLESIAFSLSGSNKKLVNHIKNILKLREIEQYCIVHVDNENAALELSKIMSAIIGFSPEYVEETSSIVAVGAGAGAVALSYLLKKEV